MINTSAAYKQQVKQSGRKFVARGKITFPTGVVVPLTSESFMQDGISIYDSTSADDEFSVGMVAINKATMALKNFDGEWNRYDFTDAVLNLEVGMRLPDGTTEWLQKGVFTVYEPVALGGAIIEVSAKDNMRKFDRQYDTPLAYPATLAEILRDACTQCGVVLSTQTFTNSDYIVSRRPADEATTYRDVVSYVAQLAGCWARCNNLGELALGWYDMDRLYQDSGDGISGGNFTDYNHDNVVSGGDFTTYDHDDILSGGVFRQGLQPPAELNFLKSCKISTDDVRVTGVQIIPDDDSATPCVKGTPGYVVTVKDNLLAQDNLEQLTANLAAKLIDFRFRPMQVAALDDPSIEAGDVAWVTDPKGHRYATIISNLSWSMNSFETFVADAETPAQRQQTRFSATAKAVQAAKQQAARQISTYDLMVQQLAETIALAAGTFQTVEKLDDGSQIVYLHDKPTLAESQKIWKHTANAFAVSNDGGKTWAGMTADGNLIAAVLTVIGINADWMRVGTITSPVNPNVYLNLATGALQFAGANGKGMKLSAGGNVTFDGDLSAAGGTFSGNLNAAGGTFKGALSAATGSFAGALSAATGTFSGSLNWGTNNSISSDGSKTTISATGAIDMDAKGGDIYINSAGMAGLVYMHYLDSYFIDCHSGSFSELNGAQGATINITVGSANLHFLNGILDSVT